MAGAPLPTRFERIEVEPDDVELRWLWRARRAAAPIAPLAVVPLSVEIDHYRLNNLPEQLAALFRGVDLRDPDEDDLEVLGPEAEALVLGHALQQEVVDAFYAALEGLPERLVIRRAGGGGRETLAGRPALLALKRTWAEEWRSEPLRTRLLAGGTLAPEAHTVLLHDADVHEGAAARPHVPAAGPVQRAWTDGRGSLLRVLVGAPEPSAAGRAPGVE